MNIFKQLFITIIIIVKLPHVGIKKINHVILFVNQKFLKILIMILQFILRKFIITFYHIGRCYFISKFAFIFFLVRGNFKIVLNVLRVLII
jgi:hypothetical protein